LTNPGGLATHRAKTPGERKDFMFQLTIEEFENMKSQNATLSLPVGKAGWGDTAASFFDGDPVRTEKKVFFIVDV